MDKNFIGIKRAVKHQKLYWFIILFALLPLAFTWFGQGKKKQEPKKQESSGEKSEQSGGGEVQAVPVFSAQTPSVKPVKVGTSYPTVHKVYKPVPVAVPVSTPSIDKIRQQISDIIRLNEDLKRRNQTRVIEIQRITDQARVHQQILAKLEVASAEEKKKFKSSDIEEILKQEKIRLISDETEKNRQRLNKLNKEGDSKSGKKDES